MEQEAPIRGANGETQWDGWNFCGSKNQVTFPRLDLQDSMATLNMTRGKGSDSAGDGGCHTSPRRVSYAQECGSTYGNPDLPASISWGLGSQAWAPRMPFVALVAEPRAAPMLSKPRSN